MKLNELFNIPGSVKVRKRVGRGNGSGTGRTCGRGEKGQKSRSGVSIKKNGEQTSLIKQLPKRGFRAFKPTEYTLLSIDKVGDFIVSELINPNEIINKDILVKIGYIKNSTLRVKLLNGEGKLEHKLSVQLDAYSKAAKSVIEEAGGKVL